MADKKEDISEDELDQIIQDMSKDEEVEIKPKPAVFAAVQGKKALSPDPVSQQALTLELNGVINLKLSFKNGDRNIEVICSEEALVCRMADGTEFRIPTSDSKVRKAA